MSFLVSFSSDFDRVSFINLHEQHQRVPAGACRIQSSELLQPYRGLQYPCLCDKIQSAILTRLCSELSSLLVLRDRVFLGRTSFYNTSETASDFPAIPELISAEAQHFKHFFFCSRRLHGITNVRYTASLCCAIFSRSIVSFVQGSLPLLPECRTLGACILTLRVQRASHDTVHA